MSVVTILYLSLNDEKEGNISEEIIKYVINEAYSCLNDYNNSTKGVGK
jgi:hypothetical protein